MLDAGVILKAIAGEILAISTALETAMWHLRHQWDVGINPDTSEVKGLSHPHCASMVFGPDRRCQAVIHAIGHRHRLCLIGKLLNGNHRPKDFRLNQLIALLQISNDGRCDEVAS